MIADYRQLWRACPRRERKLCFQFIFLGVVRVLHFRWLQHNLPLHFQTLVIITSPLDFDPAAFARRAEEAWAEESRNV